MQFSRVKHLVGIGDRGFDVTQAYSVIAVASTNAALICNSACVVTAIHAVNVNAAVRYLRLYDTATIPTAGSGTPVRRYAIPGATTGAGFVLTPAIPMAFFAGLGLIMSTGGADSDTGALTAGDVMLTIEYA